MGQRTTVMMLAQLFVQQPKRRVDPTKYTKSQIDAVQQGGTMPFF
jgi:hypothetical protein